MGAGLYIMSDILDLLASRAPVLMKTGGGSLPQELDRNFLTSKIEARLRELVKQPLNQRQIGEQLGGIHQAQVSRWLAKLKLKANGARKSPNK